MSPNVIFSGKFDDFKPVFWSGNEVYKYSSQLKKFISQQLGDDYANLFAEPMVSDDFSKIRWFSEIISPNAKKLSQLPQQEQIVAKHKLKSILAKINEFADDLIKSGQTDAVRWGEIIQNATDVPSFDYIYVENGNIVLTAWGFSTKASKAADFVLKKEILFEKPLISNIPPIIDVKPEKKIVKEVVKQEPIVTPETKNISTNSETKTEEIPPQKEEKSSKKTPFYKKWWFWTILVAIILVILYLIFLCCKGSSSPDLPNNEGEITPIDTTNIVEDPNGRTVISNQLILYIGSKDKTVEELATDFKKLYPEDDYKVVYFNTKGAKRINIEFPESKKEEIKTKLKEELKDYNLVIVDEAIFNNEMVPPDPGFSDPQKSWSYKAVEAYPAWDVTEGNPDIIVAIIDDGFDLSHPEFEGKIILPFNIPAGNEKPNVGDVGMFHGTHVAATAIGDINTFGMCGIAPNCGFMPIQVGDRNGNMSTTAIIDAIFYAIDNGADVVNMSLGMPALPGLSNISQEAQEEIINNTYQDDEELWNQIFEIADENNVTFVLAGGNDDVLIGLDPMQRCSTTIKVSAVNPNLEKAVFSNYGKYSTISAPGVEIYSALPDDKFGFLQGTSMASPMVTGGVALLKSENPNLTNEEIIKILQETGIEINSSDKHIGNLMQLSVALGDVDDSNDFEVDCPEIQEQIDSLLREIEELKKSCEGSVDTSENLIIPDDAQDFEFATGLWKSTSDLTNSLSNEPVELYFQFNNDGTGEVTFLEADGNKCYSDLTLALVDNSLTFTQTGEALCEDSERYLVHTFVCKSEDNNVANCVATTSDGDDLIEFTLERVK